MENARIRSIETRNFLKFSFPTTILIGSTILSTSFAANVTRACVQRFTFIGNTKLARLTASFPQRLSIQCDPTSRIKYPRLEESETVPLPASNRESNLMETSTDSLELEDNIDKKHHPLCRSSDSLEMKTTLDFPSLSSDSLNNVRDAREMQSDVAEHAASVRRISSDSLDMPLLEQQDAEGAERRSNEDDRSDGVTSDNSLERRSETAETETSDGKIRTKPSTNT